jgi:hypothetical protein
MRSVSGRKGSFGVRVVFTDFDGVLHPASSATDLKRSVIASASAEGLRAKGLFVHAHLLAAALGLAGDADELRVVVHSSWRAHFRDDEIRRFIPELDPWYLGTVGFTTLARDAAILKWLEMTGSRVTDYLVLDDSPKLFAGGAQKWAKLLLCDPEKGLADPAVKDELRKFVHGRRDSADDLGTIDFEPVDIDALIAERKQR